MPDETEHGWFTDRIAAYLAGGLAAAERARFEAHAASCDECARELNELRELEGKMTTLLAPTMARPDFEDRLIAAWRDRTTGGLKRRLPRWDAHPAIRRAAVAAAAIIVLGGFGYVANDLMQHNHLPGMQKVSESVRDGRAGSASNFRQLASAVPALHNDFEKLQRGPYDADDSVLLPPDGDGDGIAEPHLRAEQTRQKMAQAFTGPSLNAARWDFGGGANNSLNWSKSGENDQLKKIRSIGRAGAPAAAAVNEPQDKVLASRFLRDGSDRRDGERGEVTSATPTLAPAQQQQQAAQQQPQAPGAVAAGVTGASGSPAEVKLQAGDETRRVQLGTESQTYSYFNPNDFSANAIAAGQGQGGQTMHDVSSAVAGKEASAGNTIVLGREFQVLRDQDAEKKPADAPKVVAANDAQPGQAVQQTGGPTGSGTGAGGAPGPAGPPTNPTVATTTSTAPSVLQRKVIRNGDVEFEVDGFDAAFVTISKIVAEEGGFIATTNSEKLPNGKVKGTIVVRCGPDHLDVLVLKLRGIGELKRQNLTAQDVSKEYTDIESELRAAKAMQERLLEIIKSGKGEVKDLVAAEKELGTWRTKSEKLEGQIRYYDNLVALSTLSINLYEKDVKSAAMATQRENVDIGVESEDVDKSRAEAIKAIDEAKGRIVESELKKFDAGQLAAKIVADISPDSAGTVVDRLKQLGKVARLEMSRQQTTANGQPPVPNARIERGDTHVVISLYNLANIAPRQTSNVNVACDDVEDAYAKILSRVNDAGGRVVTSNLNRAAPQQTSATIQFEVKSDQAEATLGVVRGAGEVMKLTVTENPDANSVTAAKRGFNVQLMSMSQVQPRETNQRSITADDVEKAYQSILAAVQSAKARVLVSKLESTGTGAGQVNGYLDFEIKRTDAAAIEKAIGGAGDAFNRNVTTAAADAENASASKVQYKLVIQNVQTLPPRLQQTIAVEVHDVDGAVAKLTTNAQGAGGRVIDSTKSREVGGQTMAQVVLEVPLSQAAQLIDAARDLGTVRVERSQKNPQAPEGNLARARVEVTLATPDTIVSANDGLWATIRRGLSTSVAGLLYSLQLIIIGLCFVGPWVLLIVAAWKLAKRSRRKPVAA